MKKIYVADYTLKHLAIERKNPLLFREKVAIATAIDNTGVDTIELCPVSNFKEDKIVCKTIAKAVKNSAIAIPAGNTVESINEAWECISAAEKPILQIILPLSTVQMEYTYHIKAAKMMPIIEKLVKAAKEKCENVEFVAVDSTRAEEQVLDEAIRIAIDNGATAITLCDDAGTLFPLEFAEFVQKIKEKVSVPVYVKVSGDLYMETAIAYESLIKGADGVKSVVKGHKQLKTAKIAKVVSTKGEAYDISTNLNTTRVDSDSLSLIKKIDSTETTVTSTVTDNDDVYLDGDSTIESISEAAEKLGYELTEEDAGKVYTALMRVCEKKGSIGAKELEALIASYAMQAPSTYHLESYSSACGNLSASMAHVVLTKDGEKKITGIGTGDGPIDAAFSAIEQAVGFNFELDDFQINTVTQGKESLGSALIKLRNRGKLYSGNGISTDIVGACIRAYVNALNKIVYEDEV